MKRKFKFSTIVFVLLVLAILYVTPIVLAENQAETQGDYIQHNHGLGAVPGPIDLSFLTGSTNVFTAMEALPEKYDLRDYNKLTPVKDQGPEGTCWAFSSLASLESCQLPYEERDFSENHLVNTNGFDRDRSQGGNPWMTMAYLTRWGGPVDENDDPYSCSGISPAGLSANKHVQEVLILPNRSDWSDNTAIKNAIVTYGAVNSDLNWANSNYKDSVYSYYYSGPKTVNHAINIVGWNDNFPKDNFIYAAPENGAFLCRNSWGSNWGDGGYFWISYCDTSLANSNNNVVFINADSTSNYDNIYQYDLLGMTGCSGYGYGYAGWGANIFTARNDEYLAAVGSYFLGSGNIKVYVYKGPKNSPTQGNLANEKELRISQPGYHTIVLDEPILVTAGETFSVVIMYYLQNTSTPIPIETASANSDYSKAHPGESFQSQYGYNWTDLSTTGNKNVCIKAYTKLNSGPQLLSTTPVDNSTLVQANVNLTLRFNKPVIAQPAKNVIIYSADNSPYETIPADDIDRVLIRDNVVIINPTKDFEIGSSYYINIDSGAFKDKDGGAYAGLYLNNRWNFTVAEAGVYLEPPDVENFGVILTDANYLEPLLHIAGSVPAGISAIEVVASNSGAPAENLTDKYVLDLTSTIEPGDYLLDRIGTAQLDPGNIIYYRYIYGENKSDWVADGPIPDRPWDLVVQAVDGNLVPGYINSSNRGYQLEFKSPVRDYSGNAVIFCNDNPVIGESPVEICEATTIYRFALNNIESLGEDGEKSISLKINSVDGHLGLPALPVRIIKDIQCPRISPSLRKLDNTHLSLSFTDEQLSGADNLDNYHISIANGPEIIPLSIVNQNTNQYTLEIPDISSLSKGDTIVVRAVNITDRAGNFIDPKLTALYIEPSKAIIAWSKAYNNDCGLVRAVQQTSDGGFITAGSALLNSYTHKIHIIKTDYAGNITWERFITGIDGAIACDVKELPDKGFLITGHKVHDITIKSQDTFLSKLNSDGSIAWEKTCIRSPGGTANQILLAKDGGFVLIGSVLPNYQAANRDLRLIKTDDEGNVIWNYIGQNGNNETGYAVQECSEGGYLAVGQSDNYLYMIKVDSNGNKLWDKLIYEYGSATDIQSTADGGYIITGRMPPDNSTESIYLLKINKNAELEWGRTYGGKYTCSTDGGESVQQTIDGGYICTGSISKGYLFKTDSVGNLLWDYWLSNNTSRGMGVSLTKDKGYIVTGQENPNLLLFKLSSDLCAAADITSFAIPGQTGSTLINHNQRVITIEVLEDCDLGNLSAAFTLSPGAKAFVNNVLQESGVTVNDFSCPVIYSIQAEDKSYADWTVNVNKISPAQLISAVAIDDTVSIGEDKKSVVADDNSWNIQINKGTLKNSSNIEDLIIYGLPDGIRLTVSNEANNLIRITAYDWAICPLILPVELKLVVKSSAIIEADLRDSQPISLFLKPGPEAPLEKQPFITTADSCITMADGNKTVSPEDNSWTLNVEGVSLRENVDASDLEITGLPDGLLVKVKKQENNQILIIVEGNINSELTDCIIIKAKLKKSAFTEPLMDSNEVILHIQISNCFIATAAYGSYLDSHVRVLRCFRDRYLANFSLGRSFIKEYYQHSPAIAEVIRNHPSLKWMTRMVLTPIVFGIEYPVVGLVFLLVISRIVVHCIRRITHHIEQSGSDLG